ncbi:MAG: hypothetical protein QHJ82_15585, partial [Verrucomicrobiota bacterium]|nr:hypothetical protein [Verrucomicrobiota bacterium]
MERLTFMMPKQRPANSSAVADHTRRIAQPSVAYSLLMLFCPLLALCTATADFHVSPAGSDSNPGTASSPFATLERARDAVRELKREKGLPAGG